MRKAWTTLEKGKEDKYAVTICGKKDGSIPDIYHTTSFGLITHKRPVRMELTRYKPTGAINTLKYLEYR